MLIAAGLTQCSPAMDKIVKLHAQNDKTVTATKNLCCLVFRGEFDAISLRLECSTLYDFVSILLMASSELRQNILTKNTYLHEISLISYLERYEEIKTYTYIH